MNSITEKEKKLNSALERLKNLNFKNPELDNSIAEFNDKKNQLEIEKKDLEDKYNLLKEDYGILSKKIEWNQDGDGCRDPCESRKSSRERKDKIERSKDDCIKQIIYLIEHSIQNCNQEYKRSPSDPCKAINDRISGKESLIRGHMMGKRADFTGRTVLGPNRSISFGEIATPNLMKEPSILVSSGFSIYKVK